MTYAYDCKKCMKTNFSMKSKDETSSEGNTGMKSSCCHKCSNPECKDYGECNCTVEMLERRIEQIKKRIEEGWIPPVLDEELSNGDNPN